MEDRRECQNCKNTKCNDKVRYDSKYCQLNRTNITKGGKK